MTACNICGGADFAPGPGNRMSKSGEAPLCVKCRSIERHRVGRVVMDATRDRTIFKTYSLLTWGEQGIVAKGWYDSNRQLDANSATAEAELAAIPDESVDFMLCAYVLQLVADPLHVLREITRVLSARGLALLSYPNPMTRMKTEEWGASDPARGPARRSIGRDFEHVYAEAIPDTIVMAAAAADPVTGDEDLVYLLTKNPYWMRRLFQVDLDVRILE